MKLVILAGGLGTRLSEETDLKPKPMVEIGGMPIIWHIMKYFSHFGINDFIICGGYKGYVIKDYFYSYYLRNSNVKIDLSSSSIDYISNPKENWKITIIDTGLNTMTGGRLLRIKEFIQEDNFFMTYGDGLSTVDIDKLFKFHIDQNKIATLTAVNLSGRFGEILLKDNMVSDFNEKPSDAATINGGFFVLSKSIFDYIQDDDSIFEQHTLPTLAKNKNLAAFRHLGFWRAMDTLRDKTELEFLWNNDRADWKIWS